MAEHRPEEALDVDHVGGFECFDSVADRLGEAAQLPIAGGRQHALVLERGLLCQHLPGAVKYV